MTGSFSPVTRYDNLASQCHPLSFRVYRFEVEHKKVFCLQVVPSSGGFHSYHGRQSKVRPGDFCPSCRGGSSPIKIHVYGKGMHQVLHALSIWRSPQFVTFGPSLGVFFPLSSQRMPHHGGSKQGVYPILNSMFMVRARTEHFMPFLYGGVSGL